MSKQLTLSAAVSTLAMAALAFAMGFGEPRDAADGGSRAATTHGSIVSVLLKA